MRRVGVGFLVLAAIALGVPNLNAQESLIPERTPPLVLTGAIPLPSVHGRIDHMGFDPKGRLFISALGNNTEEVVDPSAGIRSHTITGIPKPQGVIYCAELNKLFVGSDEGKLYVYNAKSFDRITSIDFGDELDNLRYDAAANSFMSVMGTKTMERSAWSTQPQGQRFPAEGRRTLQPRGARIPSAVDARTAGYFGKGRKGFEVFYLAVPARADAGAEVLVYTVQD